MNLQYLDKKLKIVAQLHIDLPNTFHEAFESAVKVVPSCDVKLLGESLEIYMSNRRKKS